MQRDVFPSLVSALVHHYDDLVDYLRRRFGDKGFAREVVQDVCVQLLEAPAEKAGKKQVQKQYAFLRHVSTQLAIDRYRVEQGRARVVESVAELPDYLSGAPSQEERLGTQQVLDVLTTVIENLPPRCREVFILHKIHEIPQAEVAARLKISRQMVEKHLRAGMLACREKLAAVERQ